MFLHKCKSRLVVIFICWIVFQYVAQLYFRTTVSPLPLKHSRENEYDSTNICLSDWIMTYFSTHNSIEQYDETRNCKIYKLQTQTKTFGAGDGLTFTINTNSNPFIAMKKSLMVMHPIIISANEIGMRMNFGRNQCNINQIVSNNSLYITQWSMSNQNKDMKIVSFTQCIIDKKQKLSDKDGLVCKFDSRLVNITHNRDSVGYYNNNNNSNSKYDYYYFTMMSRNDDAQIWLFELDTNNNNNYSKTRLTVSVHQPIYKNIDVGVMPHDLIIHFLLYYIHEGVTRFIMYDGFGQICNYTQTDQLKYDIISKIRPTSAHISNLESMDININIIIYNVTSVSHMNNMNFNNLGDINFVSKMFLIQKNVLTHSYFVSLYLKPTQWVLTIDLDEYITTVHNNKRISDYLTHFEAVSIGLINIGNYVFESSLCLRQIEHVKKNTMFFDKMVFRDRKFNNFNVKSLYQPKYIKKLSIHQTVIENKNGINSIENSKDYLVNMHFRETWKYNACKVMIDSGNLNQTSIQFVIDNHTVDINWFDNCIDLRVAKQLSLVNYGDFTLKSIAHRIPEKWICPPTQQQ